MDRNRVTVRYAKAIIDLASENGVLDKVDQNLRVLYVALNEYPGFRDFVLKPVTQNSSKIKKMEELFEADFESLTMSFILLVFENNRESFFVDIIRNALDLSRTVNNIVTAELVVAQELDETLISKLKSRFEQKTLSTIELTTSVDPDLIGGFTFTIDGEQYDASVATSLKSIRKQLDLN
jgi:F-type H+-transporting ATPase subunit delta